MLLLSTFVVGIASEDFDRTSDENEGNCGDVLVDDAFELDADDWDVEDDDDELFLFGDTIVFIRPSNVILFVVLFHVQHTLFH